MARAAKLSFIRRARSCKKTFSISFRNQGKRQQKNPSNATEQVSHLIRKRLLNIGRYEECASLNKIEKDLDLDGPSLSLLVCEGSLRSIEIGEYRAAEPWRIYRQVDIGDDAVDGDHWVAGNFECFTSSSYRRGAVERYRADEYLMLSAGRCSIRCGV